MLIGMDFNVTFSIRSAVFLQSCRMIKLSNKFGYCPPADRCCSAAVAQHSHVQTSHLAYTSVCYSHIPFNLVCTTLYPPTNTSRQVSSKATVERCRSAFGAVKQLLMEDKLCLNRLMILNGY